MERKINKWVFVAVACVFVLLFGILVLSLKLTANTQEDPGNPNDIASMANTGVIPYKNGNIDLDKINTISREARKIKDNIVLPSIQEIPKIGDNKSISFNSAYSDIFVTNNKVLYRIVAYYFSPDTFADTKWKDYADPLYIMAVSNVEYGGLTSPDVLLAPALPTRNGVPATKDNLLNFGYKDYFKYPSLLRGDRKSFRGPMQIFPTNLVKPIRPDEIRGSEYLQLLSADKSLPIVQEELNNLQYVEGSGVSSIMNGNYVANAPGTYGDRYNYADCVNRLSGYIKYQWNIFSKQNDINKEVIDSRYAWMAMTAIGHNSSPGIYSVADTKTLDTFKYYWWPYASFGAAREYCHYLGTEPVVNEIKTLAYNNVDASRKGGNLVFRLGRVEGYALAEHFVSEGLIPKDLWKNTMWNHEEKVSYPLLVLYNYFVLDAIYHGR